MALTKDELAALLSGKLPETVEVEAEATEDIRVAGEITYVDQDTKDETKEPIDMGNVAIPEHLKPTSEHPAYVSGRLVWSRSLAFSRVELEVKVFFPTDPENIDEALDYAIEVADRKVRSYAYGVAEKELESWMEHRNRINSGA